MRKFETGATRDTDTNKYDYEGFLHPDVLEAYAAYMHKNRIQADGNTRDSDNWQKGIPKNAYIKSMFRHFMEVWALHRSASRNHAKMKEALSALLFNVMGYLFETIRTEKAEQFDPVRAEAQATRDSLASWPKPNGDGFFKENEEQAIWRGQTVRPTEEELRYEDYAPQYNSTVFGISGMEHG